MRERAEMMGGVLKVETQTGAGVCIRLEIPQVEPQISLAEGAQKSV
jgi:hypothetical protein